MNKPVEFTYTASRQLLKKGIPQSTAINVVQDTPKDKREYYDTDSFRISFRRKKKWIIFWIREYDNRFLVKKLHGSNYSSIRLR